jgi:hypothetical protein
LFPGFRRHYTNRLNSIGAIEIAVAADRLVLPITKASAAVWALDRIDP